MFITSAKAEVMWSVLCRLFCLSFCVHDYYKSNQTISFRLGVMIGCTTRKNWLTFGGDPLPDTDSGSLFHFRHQGILGYLLACLIQSLIDFHDTRQNDWCWQGSESTTFWEWSETSISESSSYWNLEI